jgi:hypothetical protein
MAVPVSAARQQQRASSNTIDANVYMPTEALKSVFQDQMNQQVAGLTSSMIAKMLANASSTDQHWMQEMATALLQPSATLTDLTPQKDGLTAKLNISMYSGDSRPVNTSMLVTLSVRDASTIQVSVQPASGGAQLANGGQATTLTMPIGQLKSIKTTTDCGNMALNVNVQLPFALNTSQTNTQSQNNQVAQVPQSSLPANQTLTDIQKSQVASTSQNQAANTLESYVEIPASSLSTMGSSIGSFPIPNSPLQAQNLRISTQGNNLVIVSDIAFARTGIVVGTATTLAQPTAQNGNLVLLITSTTVKVAFLNFPDNSYNQQLQDTINGDLNNAIAGRFTVDSVGIGGGTPLPCAATDSLVLHGTTNLG